MRCELQPLLVSLRNLAISLPSKTLAEDTGAQFAGGSTKTGFKKRELCDCQSFNVCDKIPKTGNLREERFALVQFIVSEISVLV